MSNYLYLGGIYNFSTGRTYIFSEDAKENKIEHTIVASSNTNDFTIIDVLPWRARAWYELDNNIFIVGGDSQYCIYNEENIIREGTIIDNYVYVGAKKLNIGNIIYGMGELVVRHEKDHNWVLFNNGIAKDHFGTQSIDCNSKGDCYLVGWKGAIYSLENNTWHEDDSPVNTILTSCLVSENGMTDICGKDGVLLKGKKGQWVVLKHHYKNENFWELFRNGDDRYLASTTNIFKIIDDKIIPVLGWSLEEYGCFTSFMLMPNGFWVFVEKKIYKYINGKWI